MTDPVLKAKIEQWVKELLSDGKPHEEGEISLHVEVRMAMNELVSNGTIIEKNGCYKMAPEAMIEKPRKRKQTKEEQAAYMKGWYRRQMAKGLCARCNEKATHGSLCNKHWEMTREAIRRRTARGRGHEPSRKRKYPRRPTAPPLQPPEPELEPERKVTVMEVVKPPHGMTVEDLQLDHSFHTTKD